MLVSFPQHASGHDILRSTRYNLIVQVGTRSGPPFTYALQRLFSSYAPEISSLSPSRHSNFPFSLGIIPFHPFFLLSSGKVTHSISPFLLLQNLSSTSCYTSHLYSAPLLTPLSNTTFPVCLHHIFTSVNNPDTPQ